jgi:hypothetical protein
MSAMDAGTNGYVFGLDAPSGAVRNGLLLAESIGAGDYATAVATDGTTLLAGTHGYVYAVALSDWSKAKWSAGVGGTGAFKQVAVLASGGRFFAGSNGYLYEFTANSSTPVHTLLLTSRFGSGDYTTSLATDGSTLYVGVHGFVYAVSLGDWSGAKWDVGVGGTLAYDPVNVLWDGNRLFAGSNGSAYELNPSNGHVVHNVQLSGSVGTGDYTTRLASDGTRLFAGVHGYVYGVSLADWSKAAWYVPVGLTATYPRVDVLALAGRVYAGAAGYAYAIDPASGALLRTLPLGSTVGIGDYDTHLASDGHSLYAGVHGYVYRLLTLYPQGAGPIGYVAAATNPAKDLHVVVLDRQDGLWHTIRNADGTWPYQWGNVLQTTGAPFRSVQLVATATFANAYLNVLAIDEAGAPWHVLRNPNGSWTAWIDVQKAIGEAGHPSIGPVSYVATIADLASNLHVLVLDAQRTLWHTIRKADGSWPYAWGNVQAAMGVNGSASIGPPARVAGAIDPNGDLQIAVLDETGQLRHTIRRNDGSWPFGWGDVDATVPKPPIGQLRFVSVATSASGDLSVLATDQRGKLWHTIRDADGTWPYQWGDVNATVAATRGAPLDPTVISAAAIDTAGALHVLVIDEPAGLFHTMRDPSGAWPIGWRDVQAAILHQSSQAAGSPQRETGKRVSTISSEKDEQAVAETSPSRSPRS